MLSQLSARSLFRFEIPVRYRAAAPRADGDMHKWSAEHLLPALCEVDGQEPLADVYLAWNERGLLAAFDVPARTGSLVVDPQQWWKKDGLRLCIDTRDARDVKRGTRFCHFFYVLPLGGGSARRDPIVGLHRMSRAKESPPVGDLSSITAATRMRRRGYAVEIAIPAACLHGWDPVEHPRIGLFYKIRDVQLGSQSLSAADESGWNVDPSAWATGVLTR